MPGSLSKRKAAVDQAHAGWVKASRKDVATVRAKVRDGSTLTRLLDLFQESETFGGGTAGTRLNTALAGLAGETCTAVGSVAVQEK